MASGRHAAPRPVEPPRAGSADAVHVAPASRERSRRERSRRERSRRERRGSGRLARSLLHPLTLICAVQAAGSLALVWSNTAFTDEADYLRVGHLIIGHWLHGKSWPAGYADKVMSGSPMAYPPLGALADSAAGLAGARIASLAFMVAATVLVFHTAARLLGKTEAVIAAALWALSEPVLRLAFATYDPMSVLLVALAAWLAVEAAYRRGRPVLVLCSAAALGLAVAVAYSAIAITPVVVAFAFLTWWYRFDVRLAVSWTATLTAVAAAVFALVITASRSWAGIAFTVFDRSVNDYQDAALILGDVARASGLVILLAVIGAAAATRERDLPFRLLLVALGATGFVVPAAQLYMQTGWALDKHVAYGMWFASIAGGYGCVAIARWLREAGITSRATVLAAGLTALAVVAAANWQLASLTFRSWPEATSFVASFERVAPRNHGMIFGSAQKRVAAYYAPEGAQWWLWKATAMSLDPTSTRGVPRDRWYSYFAAKLRTTGYGLIALFYRRRPGMRLPASTVIGAGDVARIGAELGRLGAMKAAEPGVPALTRALERDHEFRLVAVGPYNSDTQDGIYAIWLREPGAACRPTVPDRCQPGIGEIGKVGPGIDPA